jgi:serine/threonine protein kinase
VADPAKLDRYRDVRILGTGGMGTVSLAEDTILGRQVALKRVTAAAGASGMLRLRREALVGASVSHTNLVSIYDVDETEDGQLVIIMEYVEGETLRDAIARQDGGLGTEEALRILSGAAAGLDAIHERGIVHRDVKPANVLLGKNGDVKVADLGIAAVSDRTQITTSGAIIGSLGYMAPEQMHEAEATSAIDIYALAAVAYEALSGQRARREPNPVALAYAMENKPPPDLRDVWPEAPPAAAELLKRAMDRDPARRPRSAGELVDRLRSALQAPPTAPVARPVGRRLAPVAIPAPAAAAASRSAPPAAGPHRPRRSWPLFALALLALAGAAVIVAVALASGGGTPSPRTTAHHQTKPPASASKSASSSTSPAASASSSASSSSTSRSSTTTAAAAPGPSPGDTAKTFYTLAAGHHYAQAWALADPTFQSQLGGYQSFQNTFAGDRSITINSLRTLNQSAGAATVALTTTSVRTNGTQHCSGTVQLSPAASKGGWLMHHIQIGCQ